MKTDYNAETEARLAAWTPDSKVNPEELGHHFEGDMILEEGQIRPCNGEVKIK